MQNNQPFFFPLKNPLLDSPNQAGGFMLNSHIIPPSFGGGTVLPPTCGILPFQGVEFQPSEVCPRNFIIFDQTDNRSKIMFNPAIGAKFHYAAAAYDSRGPYYAMDKDIADDDEEEPRELTSSSSSTLKEDSEDIDALLSFDDEHDECDDEEEEEVSTARTDMNYGCNSPDSCSNYESPPPRKMRHTNSSLRRKNSGCNGSDGGHSERKRLKMRKMVRALRGIIPGANQMNNSVAVLDEAVRYLKSLKVEVHKLGGVGKLQKSHS